MSGLLTLICSEIGIKTLRASVTALRRIKFSAVVQAREKRHPSGEMKLTTRSLKASEGEPLFCRHIHFVVLRNENANRWIPLHRVSDTTSGDLGYGPCFSGSIWKPRHGGAYRRTVVNFTSSFREVKLTTVLKS